MADLTSDEYLKDARQYSENDNLSDSQIINSYNVEFAPKENLVMAEYDLEADGSGAMKGIDYTITEFANVLRNENADLANAKDYQFRDAFDTYQLDNNIKARGQRDSAVGYSTDVAAELIGVGMTTIGDYFGWDDFRDYGNNIIRQQKQDIEDGQYTSAHANSLLDTYNNEGMAEFAGSVWTKVQENSAVSGLPLAAKGIAIALAAFNLPITAAVVFSSAMVASAVMSIGESAQEQDDKTGETDTGKALVTGLGVAALDYIGAGGSKGLTVGDAIKDMVAKGHTTAAKQVAAGVGRSVYKIANRFAIEAATETAQESLMMKAAQSEGGEYTSDEVKERLFDSAVLGGVMGGGISAPTIASQEISNNSQANRLREIRSAEREANLKSENEVEAIKLAVREMNTRQLLGAEEQEVREKGASVRELAATLRGLTEQTKNTAKDNIENGVTLNLDELAPGLNLEQKKNKANEVVDRLDEEEAKSDPKTDVESAFDARDRAIENEKNQRARSEKDRINSQLAMMRLAVRNQQEGQPNRSNLPLLEKADNNSTGIPADIKTGTQIQNALRDALVKKQRDEVKATPLLEYTPNASIVLSNDAIDQKKLDVLAEKRKTQEESAIVDGRNEMKGAVIGGQSVPTRNLRYKTGNELFTKKGAELLARNLQAKQDGSDYTVVPIRRGQVTGFAIEITPTTESVNESVSDPIISAKSPAESAAGTTVTGDEIVLEETTDTAVEDPRLTNEDYIEYAKIMADELIVNGGIGYRTDESDLGGGKIIGRTPSQNPDWFKNMLVEAEAEQLGIAPFKPKVKKIKEIAKKLSAGEKLTSKQDRATAQWMFNDIDFTREENIEDNLRYERKEEQRQLEELRAEDAIAAGKTAVTPVAETDIGVEDKKLPSDTPPAIQNDLQDVSPAQNIENDTARLNNETAKINAETEAKAEAKAKAKAEEQATLIEAQQKEVDATVDPDLDADVLDDDAVVRDLDDFDVPFSKGNDVEGQTIEQAELVLREDKNLAKLIDDGKLEVNSTDQVTQQEQDQLFSEGETVQGLYRDGVATVFADNNNADTTRATAWHEVFHAAVDTLSPKVRTDLLNRLEKLSLDKKAQWVVDAMAVIPESTSEANRAEELGAYAVTQYTLENNNLPASVINWVKDVIAKIKASVYKNTGILIGSLDPVMLKAIAKGWKGEGVSQDGSLKMSVASTVSDLNPVRILRDYMNGSAESVADGDLGMQPESRIDHLQRMFQDGFNRIKKLEDEVVKRRGNVLPDESQPYLTETRSSGIIATHTKYIKVNFHMPLMKRLGELGISLESLDSYLIAKHAEERNVFIAKFNDNMPDGGSGISTADAKKALAKVASDGQSKQMAELSQIIYDMNDYNITAMEEGGLIDNDLAVELRSNFKYYVPLKGKDGVKDSMGSGQGYSIGSNGIITALGRGTGNNAESPTVHALLQAEQTAIRSGKSTVGRAFIKMIAENPNPDLYSMTSSNYQRYINTETGETFEGFDKDQIPEGLVEDRHYKRVSFVTPQEKKAAKLAGRKAVRKVVYRIDPNYKERDEIFSTMVDGKAVQIEIKDPVAMEQLKKINATELGVVVQNLGTVNRFLAMINTALNPEFVITNLERDLQTAGINLAGEQGVEMAKEAMKNVPKAAKGIWANLKNGDVESEWAALFQELQEQGGTIGFFGLEDAETKFLNMQKQLQRQGTVMGRSLEKLDVLKEYVLDANASVENAVRLTAYKAAKDSGMSKAQAANLSKNLTVNFNRRGELAPILNSTYLFFNASIQGSARIMTAYKNPRVRKYLNGVVMLGFTMAVYNMEAGGEDEDGVSNWEKISPYIKSTHFIVMNPDGSGDYFKIKMPYGYNVFTYTGMAAADLAFGKQTTVMATGVNILTAALNAFNPIQGATALDTITPTALKPFVQSEFNYNFMNTPIRPENKFDNYERPDSDKAFLNTNQSLKDIAKYLNSATGGDDTRSGFIDVSPESMKHFTNWLTGGAGAFVGRLGGLVDMTARGDAPGISDIPFLRSLTGGNTNFYDNNEFYQSVNDINAVRAQYKRHVDTQTGNAGSYLKDNAGVYRLSEKLSKVKKRLKYIRTQRNEAKRKGLFEKAKRLDADVAKEMRRFNSLFRSAQTRDQDK